MLMKNIVVFTGAGISAESGLSTFRDMEVFGINFQLKKLHQMHGKLIQKRLWIFII